MTTAEDNAPARTRRKDLIDRLARPHRYDLAVIGGGATAFTVGNFCSLRQCA